MSVLFDVREREDGSYEVLVGTGMSGPLWEPLATWVADHRTLGFALDRVDLQLAHSGMTFAQALEAEGWARP